MLRFPSLSETFVAREIASLREIGWDVPIFPLWRDNPTHIHDLVRPLLPLVRWRSPLSPSVALANLRMLRRLPKRYLSTLGFVASHILKSPKRGLKGLALFPLMVWIADEAQREGVEHIHAHFASHPTLAALVARRLTGIRFSFTAHAYDLYVRPLRLREKVHEASFVITISEYNRQLIHDAVGEGTPVHVIHCGVEIPAELPRAPTAGHHIVSVARLEEKKGHRFLVDACALLRDRGVEYSCTIIGGGPMAGRLRRQIADSGLTKKVRLAGPRTSEDVQRELRRATVFALPSVVTSNGNADGIPVALMEAMAIGAPVVSTTISGIPELIEHGVSGLLVAPCDAVALADALESILGDASLRNGFRQAGYERVAKQFQLDSCVDEVARVISQTVSS